MLIQKKNFSQRNKIAISVLAIFLVAAGLAYWRLLKPVETLPPGVPDLGQLQSNLDTKVFSSPSFKSLLIRGRFPITIDRVGNLEPFNE